MKRDMKRKEVKKFIANLTQSQKEDMLDVYLNGISATCYKEERTVLPRSSSADYLSNKDVSEDMWSMYKILNSAETFSVLKKELKHTKIPIHSNFLKVTEKRDLLTKKQSQSFLIKMGAMLVPAVISLFPLFILNNSELTFLFLASSFVLMYIENNVKIISFNEFTYYDDLTKVGRRKPNNKFNAKPAKEKVSTGNKSLKGIKPRVKIEEILESIKTDSIIEEPINIIDEQYIQFHDVFNENKEVSNKRKYA